MQRRHTSPRNYQDIHASIYYATVTTMSGKDDFLTPETWSVR